MPRGHRDCGLVIEVHIPLKDRAIERFGWVTDDNAQ
jgi:hypothetical protein